MYRKEKNIVFRAAPEYLEKLDALGAKFGLDRSKTIRLAIDESIEKHINPGFHGTYFVVDAQVYSRNISELINEIKYLKSKLVKQ